MTDLIALAEQKGAEILAEGPSAMERHFTEDFELHQHIEGVPQSGVFRGLDGLRRCMEITDGTWKRTMQFTRFQYGDDLLIVYEEIVWANHETGKAPMIPAISVHRYRDGMVCRIDAYITDEDALRDTLGP
jgi:hypothetical protein